MPDIEKVTLENAAQQLKSKIRMAFVEMIPDEQWKEMVTAELKRFMHMQEIPPSWSGGEVKLVPSDFTRVCSEVFTEFVRGEIKATLSSPEWRESWSGSGRPQISEALKSWCTENAPKLIEHTVQALAGSAAQAVLQNMRHL